MHELHNEYARTIQRDRLAAARSDARYRAARRGGGAGDASARNRRGRLRGRPAE